MCHHGVLYTESNEAKSWIKNDNLYFGNRKYRRFIATKLPLSNCILFFTISVSGIIPWLNIGTYDLTHHTLSLLTYSLTRSFVYLHAASLAP